MSCITCYNVSPLPLSDKDDRGMLLEEDDSTWDGFDGVDAGVGVIFIFARLFLAAALAALIVFFWRDK